MTFYFVAIFLSYFWAIESPLGSLFGWRCGCLFIRTLTSVWFVIINAYNPLKTLFIAILEILRQSLSKERKPCSACAAQQTKERNCQYYQYKSLKVNRYACVCKYNPLFYILNPPTHVLKSS